MTRAALSFVALAALSAACALYAGGDEEPFPALQRSARAVGAAGELDTEAYARVDENDFVRVAEHPLSTFAIDVDTASYANTRRFLTEGRLPPADAVRIEELVNYFRYDYARPADGSPYAVSAEVTGCPWQAEHRLLRVSLAAREVPRAARPASHLVFLIDVSGSMQPSHKLPLLVRALALLVEELGPDDRVAIVVYAGAAGLVLPPTRGSEKQTLLEALERLEAGGSTNGGEGIALAYSLLAKSGAGAARRVILATDGDFNVGVTSDGELTRLVERYAGQGVSLSVLGFGTGNLKDATLERLADRGNGNYAYIDTLAEARKALVEQLTGTLLTVAKDVKLQLEFNPARVASYRLIGYENRRLAEEDFRDDAKDAGELGAGHTVTALYELEPAAGAEADAGARALRYQTPRGLTPVATGDELLTLRLRHQTPEGTVAPERELVVRDDGAGFEAASADTRFAAAVAAFGMLLRDSPHRGDASWDEVLAIAGDVRGARDRASREEFLALVRTARELASR